MNGAKGVIMPEDVTRLDRIEQVVIKLEADIKVMASSVGSVAKSMEKLVDMQMKQALLKQEMDHRFEVIVDSLRVGTLDNAKLWANFEANSKRLSELEKIVIRNSWITGIAGNVAWVLTSAILTGAIATAYFLTRS